MSSRRPNGFTRSAALIALLPQDTVPGRATPAKRRRRKSATVIDECLEAPTEAVQPRAYDAYPSGWCWRRARAAKRGHQWSKVSGMPWEAPCRSFCGHDERPTAPPCASCWHLLPSTGTYSPQFYISAFDFKIYSSRAARLRVLQCELLDAIQLMATSGPKLQNSKPSVVVHEFNWPQIASTGAGETQNASLYQHRLCVRATIPPNVLFR